LRVLAGSLVSSARLRLRAANILLMHAAQLHVDLLVMGAYGHPRLLEFWLGGTTQDLLTRATLPVLMSH